MGRTNILLFLYACTAIVCFNYEALTIIPKVFAGLLMVEYFIQTVHLNKAGRKLPFNWGLLCLLYFSIYSLISFAFLAYDLPGESIINIMMIYVLSYILLRIVDNIRAFDMILLGISIGLLVGYIMNIVSPPIDEFGNTSRFYGTLGNANLFALMINFCISFILQRYPLYSRTWKNIVLVFVVISAYEVMMSGSKMGLLMYLINILYLIFYIRVIKNTTALVFISIVIVSLSGYFISNFMVDNSEAFARFKYLQDVFNGNRSYSDSDMLRYNLAIKGWEMWMQKPFLGWGYGAFLFVGGYGYYTHNNMIESLVNTGIVGFILFHAGLVQLVVMAYKSNIHKRSNIIWTCFFCLMVLVSSFAIVLLAEKLFWLLFFTMIAYLNMHTKQQQVSMVTVQQLN